LKAHFAPEFWAAVMSECHPDKLVRYMGVARSENWHPTSITYSGTYTPAKRASGVRFDTINVENLTADFTVTGDVVNQGLIGIKGIGDSTAPDWEGKLEFTTLDEFIAKKSKKKTVMEPFIKLGAFKRFPGYESTKATWQYYRYRYCSGKDITQFKKEVREKLLEVEGWTPEAVEEERQRQIKEYRTLYPKRRKIPPKITNWQPKPDDSAEKVIALFQDEDYTLPEILEFEKKYLGYYLHSPLDIYNINGNCTIEDAKNVAKSGGDPILEVVVTDLEFQVAKNGKQYVRIFVSDGMQNALLLMFSNELAILESRHDEDKLVPGTGIQVAVEYDEKRGTFTVARGEILIGLIPRK
jgi:DNA polymerase III alpha subunit